MGSFLLLQERSTEVVSGAALFTGLVVLATLLLRWPIASHDVEHYIGPDEGEVVENVLEMVKRRDFDPRHPGYPGLHFYLQRIPVELRLLVDGRSVAETPRAEFYLEARRVTLAAGAATAAVVFACGLLFLSPWGAGLRCRGLTSAPLAFRESAIVNPDLMLGLFVATRFSRRFDSRTHPRQIDTLLAGIAVGLATAVKYAGLSPSFPTDGVPLASEPKRSRAWTRGPRGGAAFAVCRTPS
jgi:hypothetical protein